MILYIFASVILGVFLIGGVSAFLFYILDENSTNYDDKKPRNITLLVALILSIMFIVFNVWYVNNTESGARMIKDFQSETQGGIRRNVKVYSMTGEKTFEDEGVFDIEQSDYRLKYINEKGKVIIIYLGNSSSAIVEEVEEWLENKIATDNKLSYLEEKELGAVFLYESE